MKKLFPVLMAVTMAVISCNNNSTEPKEAQSKTDDSKEMSMKDSASTNKDIKIVAVTYPTVDPGIASFVKTMVQDYMVIKNALTNDNGSAAADASRKMNEAIKKLDKSLFTAEQKKVYDGIEDGLAENSEHIGKNADNIKHHREHFAMMSEDMYNMVKSFGAGMLLYHDFCPMYNDNKGALWLSETMEIRNPYYGKEMMDCGSVEEMFK